MSETVSPATKSAPETVSLTVELPRDLVDRLKALADRTTWDVSDYVHEALADYVPYQEREIAAVEEAIAEVDAGGPTYSNEEVIAWMESWGKPDELPPPG